MIDLAIIGGGPAGLSAGLYATRGGIKDVVLFEKGAPGGQITGSSEIENYPGVQEIKSGVDFMAPWQEQCFRFGLRHIMSEVVRVEKHDKIFHRNQLQMRNGANFYERRICKSCGGHPRHPGSRLHRQRRQNSGTDSSGGQPRDQNCLLSRTLSDRLHLCRSLSSAHPAPGGGNRSGDHSGENPEFRNSLRFGHSGGEKQQTLQLCRLDSGG